MVLMVFDFSSKPCPCQVEEAVRQAAAGVWSTPGVSCLPSRDIQGDRGLEWYFTSQPTGGDLGTS